MNHLSPGSGWLWLSDNKLPGDSVPVALPCSNSPHIHPLGGFQRESFSGGGVGSGCDCTEALIWCQLTWSTGWQQSSIALHRNCCTESTSASGHQHALCCEDLLFYDWNILLFLITRSLFLSPCLTSRYCQPTAANHYCLMLHSARAPLSFVKQGSLSIQPSQATFLPGGSHICVTAGSQDLVEIEIYEPCVEFFFFFFCLEPTDGKSAGSFYYFEYLWVIC